jgi:hypothetical protein
VDRSLVYSFISLPFPPRTLCLLLALLAGPPTGAAFQNFLLEKKLLIFLAMGSIRP